MAFKMDEMIDDIVKKIIDNEIELDLKGHFGNREIKSKDDIYFIKDRLSTFLVLGDSLKKIIVEEIDPIDAIFSEEKIEFATETCFVCGKKVRFYVEGKKIYAETECEYKDGFPEIEVEIDIPSGVLVLYNDLRHIFPKTPDRYVNYLSEIKLSCEDYAKLGVIYHFTGNSCPSIFQVSDTHLIIGNDFSEDDNVKNIKGEVVGSICTDLWWYCAVDKDLFEKKVGMTLDEFDKVEEKRGVWTRLERVKVKPGRYKATGRHHLVGGYGENTHEIFSEITLIS